MKKEKFLPLFVFLLIASFLFPTLLHADEPVIQLHAQPVGDRLTDYEITLTIFHNGKGNAHYVDSVVLLVNEEQVKVWQFPQTKDPQVAPIILKTVIKVSAFGPSMVAAKATCTEDGETRGTSLQIIP